MRPLDESESQLVVRYAIYLAEQQLGTDVEYEKLTEREKKYIEKKCIENPQLQDHVDLLKINYLKVNADLESSEIGDLIFDPLAGRKENEKSRMATNRVWYRRNVVKYPAYSAAALIAAFFCARAISELTAPAYAPVIRESLDFKFSVARTASAPENGIRTGRALFNQGKYSEAVEVFKREYRNGENAGNDTLKAMLAYHIGISYLSDAEYSLFGLFPRYALSKIDSSITYLEISRLEVDRKPLSSFGVYLYLGIDYFVRFVETGADSDYNNASQCLQKAVERDKENAVLANALLEKLRGF
ncbi:hypothetical protein L0244_02125 [bacterium]|nr:hypothetical protein [bacterium]